MNSLLRNNTRSLFCFDMISASLRLSHILKKIPVFLRLVLLFHMRKHLSIVCAVKTIDVMYEVGPNIYGAFQEYDVSRVGGIKECLCIMNIMFMYDVV